jgi:hypothetical protein
MRTRNSGGVVVDPTFSRSPVEHSCCISDVGPGGTLAGGDRVMMRRRLLYLALAERDAVQHETG